MSCAETKSNAASAAASCDAAERSRIEEGVAGAGFAAAPFGCGAAETMMDASRLGRARGRGALPRRRTAGISRSEEDEAKVAGKGAAAKK